MALDDTSGPVATVVTLAYNALVAGEFLAEGVFATDEEEEHFFEDTQVASFEVGL